jgi:hypothetical protein
MLVELHIRRTRNGVGSNISMPNGQYWFRPQEGSGDAHVCEVTDESDLAKLLAIKEYTEFGQPMVEPPPEPEPVLQEIPDEPSEEDLLQEEEDEDLELAMCETIVGMKVSEARDQLGTLSDESLAQLATMERAGQARKSLLAAIQDEQVARQEESETEE